MAMRNLLLLSARRGRDASGLAVVLPHEVVLYKRAGSPERLLRDRRFARFVDDASRRLAETEEGVAFLGHCRLMTNGTQALPENNQPIQVGERLVGVHNGIVTNAARWATGTQPVELDSALLFGRVARSRAAGRELTTAIEETFAELEGEASVALFDAEANALALATNTGSLFHAQTTDGGFVVLASERDILSAFLARVPPFANRSAAIVQVQPGGGVLMPLEPSGCRPWTLGSSPSQPSLSPPVVGGAAAARRIVEHTDAPGLRRCARCILPETYPFLTFDADGVCSECRDFQPQRPRGREALLRELERHRREDGRPDCIVALSGGRDSSYGLHLLKTELGMNPLAFTYDWGLVTDLARRNQARMCGALGVEHVIRAADLEAQRRYVRKNIHAWLAQPELGMLPIFMAGDKFFYSHARALRRETGISLVVFCAGNELERTSFKAGFAGVRENNYKNRLFGLATPKKAQLAAYYATQFLRNPRYLNESLWNGVRSFQETFIGIDDFLYLYEYEPWDEHTIERTLIERYGWETAPSTANTWRIGDGYTAFINYIYHRVAGFSEFDAFRSQQVRSGLIMRDRALELAERDNVPRMEELGEFARLVGVNLEEVLTRIDAIGPLVPCDAREP